MKSYELTEEEVRILKENSESFRERNIPEMEDIRGTIFFKMGSDKFVISRRDTGENARKSIYLDYRCDWVIERDSKGCVCLIAKLKNA